MMGRGAKIHREGVPEIQTNDESPPVQRKMMQKWADYLDKLKAGAELVQIDQARLLGACPEPCDFRGLVPVLRSVGIPRSPFASCCRSTCIPPETPAAT